MPTIIMRHFFLTCPLVQALAAQRNTGNMWQRSFMALCASHFLSKNARNSKNY
ncbi:hypothetical protein [Janthinobacterium sp. DSP2-3-3]|uniref:hypothetical protein n=1 Tax=Janthinobacterium sp. DSP2-3-3 TaxID=2804596 RepID=UPI003CF44951